METTETQTRIEDLMKAFDTLHDIQPSSDWDETLHAKLRVSKSRGRNPKANPLLAMGILLIIMLNAGFVVKMVFSTVPRSTHRSTELEMISRELFVNPVSINN